MTVAYQGPAGQSVAVHEVLGADGHELGAVEDVAFLGDHDDPGGVAVQGDADVRAGFLDLGRRDLGIQRSHLAVDVHAVGFGPDLEHLGPEFLENQGRNPVGRAVGAIEHDFQAVEGHVLGNGVF